MDPTSQDLFDIIARRHCYRGPFKADPVPRNDLQRIVQAGLQAPSGCNAQTTTFVIVDDPALMAAIADIVDRPVVRTARTMIVCCVEHRVVYKDKSFGVEDCAAAVENILLAITALGYATVWLDGVLREDQRAAQIAKLLGVPANREVRILLPLGCPAEPVEAKEKLPFDKRAWFNRHAAAPS